jgi:hypothetical protein
MPNQPTAMYSLGAVEDWVEHDGKGADKAAILMHLANVESRLKWLQKTNHDLIQQTSDQTAAEIIGGSDNPESRVEVSIEPSTEGDTDTYHHYVCIVHADGTENQPARAFRDGQETYMEMWPIPKPYTFTLTELKATVRALEEAKDTLPNDTPNEDSLGAV